MICSLLTSVWFLSSPILEMPKGVNNLVSIIVNAQITKKQYIRMLYFSFVGENIKSVQYLSWKRQQSGQIPAVKLRLP